MAASLDRASLSGVYRGRVFTLYNELAWRLRWTLSVDATGRITGQHAAVSAGGDQRRTGTIIGEATAGDDGAVTLWLALRDDEGWVFLCALTRSHDGSRERFEGRDELTSADSDDALPELLAAWRALGPDDSLSECEVGARYEWYDPGHVTLRRETGADVARAKVRSAVRTALQGALPEGAKRTRTVVGTRRVEGAPDWEAYARIEYVAARAKSPREASFTARAATGARAMKALLASVNAASRRRPTR